MTTHRLGRDEGGPPADAAVGEDQDPAQDDFGRGGRPVRHVVQAPRLSRSVRPSRSMTTPAAIAADTRESTKVAAMIATSWAASTWSVTPPSRPCWTQSSTTPARALWSPIRRLVAIIAATFAVLCHRVGSNRGPCCHAARRPDAARGSAPVRRAGLGRPPPPEVVPAAGSWSSPMAASAWWAALVAAGLCVVIWQGYDYPGACATPTR